MDGTDTLGIQERSSEPDGLCAEADCFHYVCKQPVSDCLQPSGANWILTATSSNTAVDVYYHRVSKLRIEMLLN